jgi:hypothetical protein
MTLSLLLLAAALCLPVGAAPDAALHRERIEWCDIWFTDAEKDALPRVLLVGDSITRGYFDGVEKALEGKAYCGRLTTSRSVCDPVFFQELSLVLGQYDFEVIHFNNGLHGWDYTEAEYKAGFEKFVTALKEQAPKAKLVCALTTPVQPSSGMANHTQRIPARNAIATEACVVAGIPLNDLHALSYTKPEHFSKDGVHFSDTGKAVQVEAVAGVVGGLLAGE